MKDPLDSLKDFGYRVLQVVEAQTPPVSLTDYKAIDHYNYHIKVTDINHRITAGYDDVYVVLMTREDIHKLEQRNREFEFMQRVISESKAVLSQDGAERKVRQSNPGVDEAYKHYKFMLDLAK